MSKVLISLITLAIQVVISLMGAVAVGNNDILYPCGFLIFVTMISHLMLYGVSK